MAKEKNEEVVTQEVVPTILNEQGREVSVSDLMAQISQADVGVELGSDYWTIEPGETERIVFMEMTQMNKMGSDSEMIDAVKLLGPDGKFKICADKVLVSTCRNLASKGRQNVALQIVCKGKIKTAKGSYKDLQINELIMK